MQELTHNAARTNKGNRIKYLHNLASRFSVQDNARYIGTMRCEKSRKSAQLKRPQILACTALGTTTDYLRSKLSVLAQPLKEKENEQLTAQ